MSMTPIDLKDVRKTLYIMPRQSGKTTNLINKVCLDLKEGKKPIVFTAHQMQVKLLSQPDWRDIDSEDPNAKLSLPKEIVFTTSGNIQQKLAGLEFDKIYIDDYLFLSVEDKCKIEGIFLSKPSQITIEAFSTLDRVYSDELLEICEQSKSGNDPIGTMLARGFDFSAFAREEIEAHYYSMISDPGCVVMKMFGIADPGIVGSSMTDDILVLRNDFTEEVVEETK